MAGGSGTRFGASIPKQYTEIDGKPIFLFIVEKYLEMNEINRLIIVTNKDWKDYVWEKCSIYKDRVEVVNGGSTRSESVLNGLTKAMEESTGDDIVLIHDATHPYVDKDGTKQVIEAVKKYGGATLASFEYDTCYSMNENNTIEGVIPRQKIAVGASPEAFMLKTLYNIYTKTPKEEFERLTSAGAIALANGIKMKVIKTNVLNLKITYKEDMDLFLKLYSNYFFKNEGE